MQRRTSLDAGDKVEENEEDCNDSEHCEDNYDREGLYSKQARCTGCGSQPT